MRDETQDWAYATRTDWAREHALQEKRRREGRRMWLIVAAFAVIPVALVLLVRGLA